MDKLLTLLLLVMLTYFSLRKIFQPDKKEAGDQKPAPTPSPAQGPEVHKASDMEKDPVCGTWVEAESAVFIIHEDKKIFFCSEDCRDRYLEKRENMK